MKQSDACVMRYEYDERARVVELRCYGADGRLHPYKGTPYVVGRWNYRHDSDASGAFTGLTGQEAFRLGIN